MDAIHRCPSVMLFADALYGYHTWLSFRLAVKGLYPSMPAVNVSARVFVCILMVSKSNWTFYALLVQSRLKT